MKLVFEGTDTFEALRKAQAWCVENGISYGSSCRNLPIGLMFGDYDIAKWRNLSPKDIRELHGVMKGPLRTGPITVEIYPEHASKIS